MAFVNGFKGKKAMPMVLLLYSTVAGYSPKHDIVIPTICQQAAVLDLLTRTLECNNEFCERRKYVDEHVPKRIGKRGKTIPQHWWKRAPGYNFAQ